MTDSEERPVRTKRAGPALLTPEQLPEAFVLLEGVAAALADAGS